MSSGERCGCRTRSSANTSSLFERRRPAVLLDDIALVNLALTFGA